MLIVAGGQFRYQFVDFFLGHAGVFPKTLGTRHDGESVPLWTVFVDDHFVTFSFRGLALAHMTASIYSWVSQTACRGASS